MSYSGTAAATLLDAARLLTGKRALPDVLDGILDAARLVTGARYAAVAVYDANGRISTFVHSGVADDDAAAIAHPPVGRGLLGELLVAEGPLRVDRIADEPRAGGFPAGHPPMTSFLGVPLVTERRRYGNLYVTDKDPGAFTADDEALVTGLASFAAAAIENALLSAADAARAAAEERSAAQRELLSQVIDAQEAERARVARDLHDEIGQSLTSVLLGLRLLDDSLQDDSDVGEARARAAEVRTLVTDALHVVRSLAFDLRPTVLDDVGLVPALRRLCENLAARHGISVDVDVDGVDEDERLRPEVETVLYRVVQEALTNVVRHAAATTTSVLFRRTPGLLMAIVEDDGRGFETGEVSRSLGLVGMRERAQLVAGSVVVASTPGVGTTVRLEVPDA